VSTNRLVEFVLLDDIQSGTIRLDLLNKIAGDIWHEKSGKCLVNKYQITNPKLQTNHKYQTTNKSEFGILVLFVIWDLFIGISADGFT
jgi:hypothetical protein